MRGEHESGLFAVEAEGYGRGTMMRFDTGNWWVAFGGRDGEPLRSFGPAGTVIALLSDFADVRVS